MGWGVIDVNGVKLSHVANGIVQGTGSTLADRLLRLHRGLEAVIEEFAPATVAIEQTFVNRDGAGTLKLGQARGVAMLTAARAGLVIGEYAPNTVKKAVVGVGHAAKAQIDHMVRLQLPGVEIAGADAADALAIAICHAHHGQSQDRLRSAIRKAHA
jgi:crossover junction endodeoxyribonuclease RuvC